MNLLFVIITAIALLAGVFIGFAWAHLKEEDKDICVIRKFKLNHRDALLTGVQGGLNVDTSYYQIQGKQSTLIFTRAQMDTAFDRAVRYYGECAACEDGYKFLK